MEFFKHVAFCVLFLHSKNKIIIDMQRLEVFFVTTWLLFISLSSFYFYNLGVALPPFLAASVSFLLSFFIISRFRICDVILMRRVFLFLGYIIFCGLVFLLKSSDFLVGRIFGVILFFGVAVHTYYLINSKLNIFLMALKWVLVVHVFAFFSQTFSHYSGFGYIDYLMPFTGEAQRAFGGSYESALLGQAGFVRPTGLYNEPGTYSTTIFIIFLMYKELSKSEIKFHEWIIDLAVILSIALSFSVFGMIFLFIYFLHTIVVNKKTIFIILPVFVVISPIIYELYLYPRFFSGNYDDDSGLIFRGEALIQYFEYLDKNPFDFIFGIGFFSNIVSILGDFIWNDLGLLVYSLIVFGFVGFLIFLTCVIGRKSLSVYVFPLTLIFILSKIAPSTMIFWVVLTIINYINFSKPKLIKNPKKFI